VKTLYLDTEFTKLNLDRALISIALVADDGPEFYAEMADGWSENSCSDFTRKIVLPKLKLKLDVHGMTRQQASQALRSFLTEQGDAEIVGDALAWDWPLLLELLGPAGLPENILECRGLVADDLGELSDIEDAPHHALEDARLMRHLAKKPSD
jgi:hypothetical protein